jgi:hypothetical protein
MNISLSTPSLANGLTIPLNHFEDAPSIPSLPAEP